MLTSLHKFQTHLLVAVAEATDSTSPRGVNLSACADNAGLSWLSGWIDHAAKRLALDHYIEFVENDQSLEIRKQGDIDRGICVRITNHGIIYLNSQTAANVLKNRFTDLELYFPQDSIDWIVLSALLSAIYIHENEGYLTAAQIVEKSDEYLEDNDVQDRLIKLAEGGFTKTKSEIEESYAVIQYTLTAQGTWFVVQHSPTLFDLEQWPQASQLTGESVKALEEIWDWDNALHAYLNARTYSDKNPEPTQMFESVPASDRIVPLDHNSQEYRETINAIDAVIEAVSGDNEYGATTPHEKAALIGTLNSGRALLSAHSVRLSAIRATLLPALQYVADNFTKGVVAALGAAAVAAVLKLLGAI